MHVGRESTNSRVLGTASSVPSSSAQDTPVLVLSAANPICPSAEDLPPLVWQGITHLLDDYSLKQLKLTSRSFCKRVRAAMKQSLSLTVSDLKHSEAEELAAECPARAASCLCITPPRKRIALSKLNHRQRCEQHLAVFFDNLGPCPTLTALDISTALSHISCSTLQLLVESLPQLHQLSLPPVVTQHRTEADALAVLGQLPSLCACDLDCSLFCWSNSSSLQNQVPAHGTELQDLSQHQQMHHTSRVQSGDSSLVGVQDSNAQTLPVQQGAAQEGIITSSSTASTGDNAQPQTLTSSPSASTFSKASSSVTHTVSTPDPSAAAGTSSSTCSGRNSPSACTGPWAGLSCLSVQHLQLQHLRPDSISDALHAVAQLEGLRSLSITGLCRRAGHLVLAPVRSRAGAGTPAGIAGVDVTHTPAAEGSSDAHWLLACLTGLQLLTRLEIGVEDTTHAGHSSSNNGNQGVATRGLVVPAHTGSTASHPAAYPAVLSSAWSGFQRLHELVLHGICLDSPLMLATLECQQLTALHVGGLELQQDVRTVTGLVPCAGMVLPSLRALQVDQHFDLGPNMAAVLFPELRSLKVTHAGSSSPDLSCLEHHKQLSSLDVAAPSGSRWKLHDLQLGYLVHLAALRELRLAENTCQDGSSKTHAGSNNGSSSPGRHASSGFRGTSPSSCKSGSHWLPSCTGHLAQVTSLELSGPVTDHALGQLPGLFPGLLRLTVDSSYFASDGGLQRLNCAPQLELLVLRDVRHVTEYGLEVLLMPGTIKVVAVHGCLGLDDKACHRIRKACRHSGSQLLWYGCDAAPGAGQSCGRRTATLHAGKASSAGNMRSSACSTSQDHNLASSPSGGSAFLQRCWRQEQQEQQAQQQGQEQDEDQTRPTLQSSSGPVSTLVAAATEVWLAAKRQGKAGPGMSVSSCPDLYSNVGREQQLAGKIGGAACWKATGSHHTLRAAAGFAGQQAVRAAGVAAGSASRARRVSSSCAPSSGPPGASSDECWNKNRWGGGRTLAH